jgi:lipopolysaccharide export system protein LptA
MKAVKFGVLATAVIISASLASFAGDDKAAAKQGAEKQSVQIQADNIAYNAQTKEITASGSVVITMKDGSTIKTDKAVVKTDAKGTSVVADKIEVKKKTEEGK